MDRPNGSYAPSDAGANSTGGLMAGNFRLLEHMKATQPELQVLISVGGGTWSSGFTAAVSDAASREAFARSCLGVFLEGYGAVFDGLDIDWEYPVPTSPNGTSQDPQNFAAFLEELRRQLDALGAKTGRRYLLTIAAPPLPQTANQLDWARIHPVVDAIHVMTYNYAGPWSQTTGFNAPLEALTPGGHSVAMNMRQYLARGIPGEKLMVGVPYYGRGWNRVPNVNDGLGQARPDAGVGEYLMALGNYDDPAQVSKVGDGSGKPPPRGIFDYWHVAGTYLMPDSGFVAFRHPATRVPWLYSADAGIFISYDDAQSVREKAEFARDAGLGGAFIWELSGDVYSAGGAELTDALRHGLGR